MTLSERFPQLTPIRIRQERASEVFLLMERLGGYIKRQNAAAPKINAKGHRVIRRPAGDDWF